MVVIILSLYCVSRRVVPQAMKSDRNKIGVERKADDNDSTSRKLALEQTTVFFSWTDLFSYRLIDE